MNSFLSAFIALVFSSAFLLSASCTSSGAETSSAKPLKVLILDGHNPYHDWEKTTPILQHILRDSGRFTVDIATAPPEGEDFSHYRPVFSDYDVIVSNYNGQHWDEELKSSFLKYLKQGGGFVAVHAANNAFAKWPEYNEVCGLGGWYGRDTTTGPYAYYKDDELVVDDSPGPAGHHGPQHEYVVRMRDNQHPITRGLPARWLHAQDELYDQMRGPAKNMHILATAYSDPKYQGTNRDEPMLMVLAHGKGRVFHTMLGHADYSMHCIGFRTTLLRGSEWAATGEVTIPVPENFPTTETTSSSK